MKIVNYLESAEATMIPVLIVPGLGGSADDHWQSYLERSLPNAFRVQQEDWERPDLTSWLNRLTDSVGAQPGAVLVAHSLGCPLVAHLAGRRPDLPVVAALLVAPADVESAHRMPSHTRGFAPIPRLTLPFRSVVVASTNDPYIEYERSHDLAAIWGAEFIGVGPCGHINVASGFGPWPAAHRMVTSIAAWAQAGRLSRNALNAVAIV